MTAIDQRIERRRNTLLGNPSRRKTLLSSTDASVVSESTLLRTSNAPCKKRKCLLTTPVLLNETKVQIVDHGDNNCNKRRALLPGVNAQMYSNNGISSIPSQFAIKSVAPVPSYSTVPSTHGGESRPIVSMAPTSNRKVLLTRTASGSTPASSSVQNSTTTTKEKSPIKNIMATVVDSSRPVAQNESNNGKRVPNIRPTPIPHVSNVTNGPNAEKKISQGTITESCSFVTKSTTTDIEFECGLPWLYEQRSLLDQRISELQERERNAGSNDDTVVYINGYYCRACSKIISGGYASKIAHCRENSHEINANLFGKDPEIVFKYFEERYEGLAFDDDIREEESAVTSNPGPGLSSTLDRHVGLVKTSSELSLANSMRDQRSAELDDDDESGRESPCERFDRTKVCKN